MAIIPAVCPVCGAASKTPFYHLAKAPVHQARLVRTRIDALGCVMGTISLYFCETCSFIWNAAFDPALVSYDDEYESTQAVSPTFNAFHERLARELIEEFDLRDKRIVEIGCGQGEFATMLAGIGENFVLGFDQAVREPCAGVVGSDFVIRRGREGARSDGIPTGIAGGGIVSLYPEFYDDRYRKLKPDFVCCKMTFEHVSEVAVFLRSLRSTVGDRPECVVFFMVPDVMRILQRRAFWDIYYEHCSYWSAGALARAFHDAGFDPIRVWTDYDDQYLLIAARPSVPGWHSVILPSEGLPATLSAQAQAFAEDMDGLRLGWSGFFHGARSAGHKVVLWGGGSKAVAFLNTLGIQEDGIKYVVDINPRRKATYIAGTGQEIVAPEFLVDYRPDAVIVMSPIYKDEISRLLATLGVDTTLISVEDPLPGARLDLVDPASMGSRNT